MSNTFDGWIYDQLNPDEQTHPRVTRRPAFHIPEPDFTPKTAWGVKMQLLDGLTDEQWSEMLEQEERRAEW